MFVEQIYTGCLSQASYFIESDGESAIIDPLREVDIENSCFIPSLAKRYSFCFAVFIKII